MIKASYEGMRNDASAITKAAGDYKASVNKLYQEVDQLADVWKGTDNQEYATKVNSYKQDMLNLGVAVDGYADFLRRAANTIQTTQESVSSAAGKL